MKTRPLTSAAHGAGVSSQAVTAVTAVTAGVAVL
ncbi:hypothetical protein Ae150APs1_6186 [Pseudonocardia sp. Ae150A_Ps1]|nr:hypothetical protein Ae150APs1_6186 [Pseudonocardia sp. Ae150A_Ps1]